MKISQREMMLGSVTLAILLFGGSWYVLKSKVERWKDMKSEIAQLHRQISANQAAIQMQDNWMGQLEALQKDLRIFSTEQRNVSPELMTTVKAISAKHELDITRTNPYEEKPTGDLFELGINCTWEGDLNALVGFLTELQQQGVRYDVRSLTITPVGRNTGRLKGNMVINCAFTRRDIADTDS